MRKLDHDAKPVQSKPAPIIHVHGATSRTKPGCYVCGIIIAALYAVAR